MGANQSAAAEATPEGWCANAKPASRSHSRAGTVDTGGGATPAEEVVKRQVITKFTLLRLLGEMASHGSGNHGGLCTVEAVCDHLSNELGYDYTQTFAGIAHVWDTLTISDAFPNPKFQVPKAVREIIKKLELPYELSEIVLASMRQLQWTGDDIDIVSLTERLRLVADVLESVDEKTSLQQERLASRRRAALFLAIGMKRWMNRARKRIAKRESSVEGKEPLTKAEKEKKAADHKKALVNDEERRKRFLDSTFGELPSDVPFAGQTKLKKKDAQWLFEQILTNPLDAVHPRTVAEVITRGTEFLASVRPRVIQFVTIPGSPADEHVMAQFKKQEKEERAKEKEREREEKERKKKEAEEQAAKDGAAKPDTENGEKEKKKKKKKDKEGKDGKDGKEGREKKVSDATDTAGRSTANSTFGGVDSEKTEPKSGGGGSPQPRPSARRGTAGTAQLEKASALGAKMPDNLRQQDKRRIETHFLLPGTRKEVAQVMEGQQPLPSQSGLVVVGDLHGQLNDFIHILHLGGEPSKTVGYLFNGDIADRGTNACEIFLIIMAWIMAMPMRIFVNRGNHEDSHINRSPACGGFYSELVDKYGSGQGGALFEIFGKMYSVLPLASDIEGRIFVVHGGLLTEHGMLTALNLVRHRKAGIDFVNVTRRDRAIISALWSDPMEQPGSGNSPRGQGIPTFGPDVTQAFLEENGFDIVIRSHQLPTSGDGIQLSHTKTTGAPGLYTLFSASNYCGTRGNIGAVVKVLPSLSMHVVRHFDPSITKVMAERGIAPPLAAGGQPLKPSLSLPPQMGGVQQVALDLGPIVTLRTVAQNVLTAVAPLIARFKMRLLRQFSAVDTGLQQGQIASGLVSVEDWKKVMISMIEADADVDAVAFVMGFVGDVVDYASFLSRFRVECTGVVRWRRRMLEVVYKRIATSEVWDMAAKVGVMNAAELQAVLTQQCKLTSSQAASIIRTFGQVPLRDLGKDSGKKQGAMSFPSPSEWKVTNMDLHAFLARIQMTFCSYNDKGTSARLPPWARVILKQIGRSVTLGAGGANKAIVEQENDDGKFVINEAESMDAARLRAQTNLGAFFTKMDADGSGLIDEDEFVLAIGEVLNDERGAIGEKDLRKLFEYLDVTKDGQVNMMEFLGFCVRREEWDGLCGGDILEALTTAVWKNNQAISNILPPSVGKPELKKALLDLNAVSDKAETALLTPEQVEILLDAEEDTVDVHQWLAGFVVVDTATHPLPPWLDDAFAERVKEKDDDDKKKKK